MAETLAKGGRVQVTAPAGGYSTVVVGRSGGRPIEPPATVRFTPGSGGSGAVQTTLSSSAEIDAGTASWLDWDFGSVSVETEGRLEGPVMGVRARAVTADATMKVVG